MTEHEHWDEFIEKLAAKLKMDGQVKNVFVARFARKNCQISNKLFIKWLESDQVNDLYRDIYRLNNENYNKCIGRAYDFFEKDKENGYPELVNKGNKKRESLLEWLENQYKQWVDEQKSKFSESSRYQKSSQNWHKVCYDRLESWKRKNIDLVRGNDRLNFDNIDQTFVPLGLWEKLKKEDPQAKNTDRQQNPQVERYEITQKFEYQQDFLDKIIHRGSAGTSSKEKGQKLAIIGETGSGKTTLLLQIGFALLKQPENTVIWISLKEVRDRKISIWEYILDDWLKGSEVSNNEWKQEFENKLRDSCVWLLLDGLEDIPDRIHSVIGQFDEWVNKPKIALTCRKSRWDSDKTDFEIFEYDIYECLGYNSDQPSNFIDDWFNDDSESANLLKLELQQATRHRINDLIRYPLYLSLLCSIYEKSELNFAFATTKAELFDQFIKRQYKRKITKDRFDADLVKSLGELAIKAIDTQNHLTGLEVKQKLGDRLEKALELGWLKPIDEYETFYDFLHDSFKEYFASLAIQALDSEYFLPTECDSNSFGSINSKKYRVFCQEWKDVILFWIGRMDIENSMKETLIYKLMLFQDNCGDFYRLRALCIATECLSEFSQIKYADLLISWITSYAFIHDLDKYTRCLYNNNYGEVVKSILKKTKVKELVINLEERIFQYVDREESESPTNDFYLEDFELAKILFFVDPNNQLAANRIIDLLDNERYHFNTQDLEDIRQLYLLSPITFNNIPKFLVNLLLKKKYKYITKDILRILTSIIDSKNYHFLMVNIVEIARKKYQITT